MDVVTKSIEAAVKPVESEHPNGEFEVILSTQSKDRDGENLWPDEWMDLPAKIHMDGDHGRSLEKTVGSCVPRFEGDQLVGKGTYAGTEYAQMVRQLVNEGHVNSVSVTYAEHKNQKGEGVQRELLNAAFVAIPANPEAIVLASKNAKLEHEDVVRRAMSEAMKTKADGGLSASGDNPQVPKHDEMVQAIHDAAIHLGAQCLNDITADPGTSDGANKSVDDTKTSSKSAGSPDESAEESAAAAKAAAAETPADDTAANKAKELEKARGLAFLISMNTKD